MAKTWAIVLLLAFLAAGCIQADEALPDWKMDGISLPPGFSISVFAKLDGSPRMMEYFGDVLLVSLTKEGKVVALPDRDGNGVADEVLTVIVGLDKPHGLAVSNRELFIAQEGRVIIGKLDERLSFVNSSVAVEGLPSGGNHVTRTILVRNETIILSIGSSCNACREGDERRAAVLECTTGGKCSIFASGLRNSVGLAFHPGTGEIWATDNGRDWLGNDLPPEEVNIIKKGKDYGWPVCYGNKVHDSEFDKNVYIRDPCADSEPPVIELQAHSAPLGLAFYNGAMFPAEYHGNLFIAYHGSWNRQPLTGYKVVRVDNGIVKDFATGWLSDEKVKGRPVDIIVAPDGALLVSDDSAGKIYRISFK